MNKCGILLINLGSPDSTDPADVKSYLKEFLTDERVIDKPFARKLIVPGIILQTRPKKSAEAYSSIWTKEGSPLVVTSKNQQKKLEALIEEPVYLAMRYGNPSIADVLAKIESDGIENLFIMPMYPQYAMSSYETVVVKVEEELKKLSRTIDRDYLQPFYNDSAYLDILAQSIKEQLPDDCEKLVFSFHGIPERHLRLSDPSHAHCLCSGGCCEKENPAHATCYKHQCLTTVRGVVKRLNLPPERYCVSFQSRLGRDPWLQPFTDKSLVKFGQDGVKKLRIVCPAFVTDCLETLEEIAVEGKELFIESGGEDFELIPCLNERPEWIHYLQSKVSQWKTNP